MSIEIHNGSAWIFGRRSCGTLPTARVHEALVWVLQQLSVGHFVVEQDGQGDGVSLTLGQAAYAKPINPEHAEEYEQNRLRSLTIARIFAKAREQGVEPEYAGLSDTANAMARESTTGRMNTAFHYAFELASLLRRISDATFLFDAPPILGRAEPKVVDMLGEATRCLLFGLFRSSVSVSRTCLEAVLRSVVPAEDLRTEIRSTQRGEIESLIKIAVRQGILTEPLGRAAHDVRKRGNDAIHGTQLDEASTWDVLDHTRQIVEHVYRNGLTAHAPDGAPS
jgi:hypothetical protein